eukprot:TRINITY_DN242_c6_g1_i1.p1 TRINITY_DN242_c6_g1~~TRINITY_DN242_c6_g1_i1.p1  ORF type:complete len:289 (-),score=66.06 TRINITY_DN242_c6_g1_i1:436-1302(-)
MQSVGGEVGVGGGVDGGLWGVWGGGLGRAATMYDAEADELGRLDVEMLHQPHVASRPQSPQAAAADVPLFGEQSPDVKRKQQQQQANASGTKGRSPSVHGAMPSRSASVSATSSRMEGSVSGRSVPPLALEQLLLPPSQPPDDAGGSSLGPSSLLVREPDASAGLLANRSVDNTLLLLPAADRRAVGVLRADSSVAVLSVRLLRFLHSLHFPLSSTLVGAVRVTACAAGGAGGAAGECCGRPDGGTGTAAASVAWLGVGVWQLRYEPGRRAPQRALPRRRSTTAAAAA